jgi:hypothetical protein
MVAFKQQMKLQSIHDYGDGEFKFRMTAACSAITPSDSRNLQAAPLRLTLKRYSPLASGQRFQHG